MPSFVAPRYFCFSPLLYLLAFLDRLISAEMPSFPRLRQDSLFLPRCHLWARHDIFDFTELPSFVASQHF
jgi:hypothetical protein